VTSKQSSLVDLGLYRDPDSVPPELIAHLESVLQAAKEGTLTECIVSFQVYGDVEATEGRQFLWRSDGRQDAIHSSCHLLAHNALLSLVGA